MSRCKAVMETNGGEFIRCSQMLQNDSDDYCYYHKKTVAGLTTPVPTRDVDDNERIVAMYRKGSMNPIVTFPWDGSKDVAESDENEKVA